MPAWPVLRLGHPTLSQPAKAVAEFNTPQLDALIQGMLDTMAAENGVGLAAPQVNEPLRLIVFGMQDNPRYPGRDSVPTTVLINPHITPIGNEQEGDWEGCLSLPGLRGWVPRYRHILYTGFDAKGQPIEREASGFHARVVQHECDHLDGILYPQRMPDMRRFGYEQELSAAAESH
ncbi:Peptide deformylase [hydrothermal vent metagenome]|uniref:Peptide deformylase n=1 Tax=hydrothermal vent metagenome TaxID=652676 RepID=A0A3B0ZVM4_9ZZZZ